MRRLCGSQALKPGHLGFRCVSAAQLLECLADREFRRFGHRKILTLSKLQNKH
jgi:hypothetical protein